MANGIPSKILETLKNHRVPFVVIGGFAVNFHGYIRATEDCDIIFSRNSRSEANLFKALKKIGACRIGNRIDPKTKLEELIPVDESFIRTANLMMLHTKHGYLDIFDYVPGFPGKNPDILFKDSKKLKGINFVSLKWLKMLKKASGRPRDIEDIKILDGLR
ncbi:MAG: hypothetical protein WAX69_22045 [Victivallales bacterium]